MMVLLSAFVAEGWACPPASASDVGFVACRMVGSAPAAAPPAAGRAHTVRWDAERATWAVDGLRVPIVGRAEILEAWGLRAGTGPDGRPWLAGGEVTVLVDGIALGDGMGGLVPEAATRPIPQQPWALR